MVDQAGAEPPYGLAEHVVEKVRTTNFSDGYDAYHWAVSQSLVTPLPYNRSDLQRAYDQGGQSRLEGELFRLIAQKERASATPARQLVLELAAVD